MENAFDILAQKWRIFFKPIETKVTTTILVVKTTCLLHNFLRSNKDDDQWLQYLEPSEPEVGAFINLENNPRRAARLAFSTREKFVNYFNS